MLKSHYFGLKPFLKLAEELKQTRKDQENLNREFVSPTYELHNYSKSNSYKLITVPTIFSEIVYQITQRISKQFAKPSSNLRPRRITEFFIRILCPTSE